MHRIQTFNQIATRGLDRFPKQSYELGADLDHADAILLRSYKMDAAAINPELKAVARAGAGTNNVGRRVHGSGRRRFQYTWR